MKKKKQQASGRRTRRSFTPESSRPTRFGSRRSGKTITAVVRELDLTETALREWLRRCRIVDPRLHPAINDANATTNRA